MLCPIHLVAGPPHLLLPYIDLPRTSAQSEGLPGLMTPGRPSHKSNLCAYCPLFWTEKPSLEPLMPWLIWKWSLNNALYTGYP